MERAPPLHAGEVPPQHQEILVYYEGNNILVQVSQKAAVLYFLGDIQSCLEVVLDNMLYMSLLVHEHLTSDLGRSLPT